jgi:hypothetical protein
MDRGYNLAYQLVAAPLSEMMNDFARVVLSPPPSNEGILAS